MKKLIILLILLITSVQVSAKNITSPQLVSEMRVNITESGFIEVTGSVHDLELNISIPQEDGYQRMEQFDVKDSSGPCRTDSCSYEFVYDSYGNKVLKIKWKNPSRVVNYTINSVFSIYRRNDVDKKILKEFIEPTELVQSADTEIAEIASEARGNNFEKVAYLSKWIGENIDYDRVYSDASFSAKEILRVRKGVCKEFSNLLVSFLRNLGYHSAVDVGYVYPGKIYETNEFQPHGWAEVYTDNGIIADPTWSEVGYLDATHVKFATFPDSSWTFTAANVNGIGELQVKLGDVDVNLDVIDFKEEPIINTNSSFLANNIWSDYAVLRTDLTSDRCLLTKIDFKSCVDQNGNDFLKLIDTQKIVYFCNERSVFTVFEIPKLDEKRSYRCLVSVIPYGGTDTGEQLSLNLKDSGYSKLVVEKEILKPSEKFLASATDSQIFTDYGEYAYKSGEFTAPNYDFKIYSYNSGYLDSKNISVVMEKPIDVYLDVNETLSEGKAALVNVRVVNLLDKTQQIKVVFRKDSYSEELIYSKYFVFNFTPSINDNLVQVFVSTPDFSTSVSKTITVIGQKDVVENFFQPFIDFFDWLFSLFK